MFDIGAVIAHIKLDLKDFQKGIKDVKSQVGKLKPVTEGMANVGNTIFSAASKGALALGAAFAGTAAVGIKFNSSIENSRATIQAFTKDNTKTGEILEFVRQESLKTQFGFTDMAQAAAGLIPASKQSGKSLEELIKQAEILAALNPSEGLTGAAFSLKEALSGDFVSIVERFNLPRKRLNELKEQGVPALEAVQTALSELGIDYDIVTQQAQTTSARWDTLKDQFTQMAGQISQPIFERLSTALADLAVWFDANKEAIIEFGTAFVMNAIDAMTKFIEIVVQVVTWLRENETAVRNAAIALGIMVGIVLVVAAVMAVMASAWTVAIVTIIALITFLVGYVTANWDKIKAFTFAVFEAIKTFFINLWNGILNFAINLFNSIVNTVINTWNRIKQAFIDGVNSAIAWFKKLPENVAFALGYMVGRMISFVINDVPNFIRGVINWFMQLPGRIETAVRDAWARAVSWFNRVKADAINAAIGLYHGVTSWFSQLPGRVGSAISNMWASAVSGFNSFKSNAINWATNTIQGIVEYFRGLPGKIASAITGGSGAITGALGNLASKFLSGIKAGLPGFARGVQNFAGGWAVVGERGPELVRLPQGSDVYPNGMVPAAAGGGIMVNVNMDGANIGTTGVAREFAMMVGDEIIRQVKRNIRT